MLGIELVADKASKTRLDAGLKVPARLVAEGYAQGVIARPLANLLAMSPPLTLSQDNITEFVGGLSQAFAKITDELVRDRVLPGHG